MTNSEKYLIINADDFGMSPQVNHAISLSFQNRLISDSSVMVTQMWDRYSKLADDIATILNGRGGVHFCLTAGKPVTENIKNLREICDNNGNFKSTLSINKGTTRLDHLGKKWIFEELIGQATVLCNLGLTITHADSHQHVHHRMDIMPIVVNACHELQIPFLRIQSCERTNPLKSKIASFYKQNYIKFHKINTVDLFGSCAQILNSKSKGKYIVEIMCHPQLNNSQVIIDKRKGLIPDECIPLENMISQIKDKYIIISYFDLISMMS